MKEVLEREIKWEVDEHFALPRLDDIVDAAPRSSGAPSSSKRLLRHTDGDLQTHGVLLRRRDGDDDTGWQLKVPDTEGRVEIRAALSDTPPAELTDLLTGLRLGKPLVNVATIRTVRDRYRITDAEATRLCAEVADDHVRASVDHRLLAWREIEIEVGADARSRSARRIAKRLKAAGANTVAVSIQTGPGVPCQPVPSRATGSAAERRVMGYMTEQIDAMFDGDLGLRRGSRPDPRHPGGDSPDCAAHCGCSASCWTGRRSATSTTNSSGSPGCSARSATVRCNARRFQEALAQLPPELGARTGRQQDQHRSAFRPIAGAQGRRGGDELAAVPRPAGDAAAVAYRTTTVRAAEPERR